jgi:hypothetical protein
MISWVRLFPLHSVVRLRKAVFCVIFLVTLREQPCGGSFTFLWFPEAGHLTLHPVHSISSKPFQEKLSMGAHVSTSVLISLPVSALGVSVLLRQSSNMFEKCLKQHLNFYRRDVFHAVGNGNLVFLFS